MEKVIPSDKRTAKNSTAYSYEYNVKLFIPVDGLWTHVEETYYGIEKGLDKEVRNKIEEAHKGRNYSVVKITCD